MISSKSSVVRPIFGSVEPRSALKKLPIDDSIDRSALFSSTRAGQVVGARVRQTSRFP
jgi:hypothetical protein